MKVVVGASSFADTGEEAMKLLQTRGIEVVKNPYGRRMTREEIIRHLDGADGLLAGLEPLDEEVFKASPDLKAVARIGIGMDNVNQKAAGKYGIKISNTPDGPTAAVAEMTLAALLCICHKIISANDSVHRGEWKKQMGRSIKELRVLLIGYGHIGRAVSEQLACFGAQIMVYDKYQPAVSTCELTEGLHQADVISLHASGTEEILSAAMFEYMKDGVILLNSARGALVNEDALYEGLQTGKVGAFWGDALWEEPYKGKVLQCDNAVLTPHICTYTASCREEMEKQAVENLLRDLGYV